MKYAVFESRFGWMALAGSEKGLKGVALPQSSPESALDRLTSRLAEAEPDSQFFAGLIERLKRYFEGDRVFFPDSLDLSGARPFSSAVWKLTQAIPYGETRSYGWLATAAGKPLAARAVGQAMANNPWPIIVPCHRVLNSKGELHGFGGGLEMKRRLLELEGVY